MKSLAFSLMVLVGSYSFASQMTPDLESCKGVLEDGTSVTFEIRATAVPQFFDGILIDVNSDEVLSQLSCKKTGEGNGNVVTEIWECSEYATPRNGIKVKVYSGGIAGRTASVTLDQMFPLPAQEIGSLLCK